MLNRSLLDEGNSTQNSGFSHKNNGGNIAFIVIFAILIFVGLSGNIATALIIKIRKTHIVQHLLQ